MGAYGIVNQERNTKNETKLYNMVPKPCSFLDDLRKAHYSPPEQNRSIINSIYSLSEENSEEYEGEAKRLAKLSPIKL